MLTVFTGNPAPSFSDLCVRYAGDIPATALLKELRKVGAAGAGAAVKGATPAAAAPGGKGAAPGAAAPSAKPAGDKKK